jgi:hypothetical protein
MVSNKKYSGGSDMNPQIAATQKTTLAKRNVDPPCTDNLARAIVPQVLQRGFGSKPA